MNYLVAILIVLLIVAIWMHMKLENKYSALQTAVAAQQNNILALANKVAVGTSDQDKSDMAQYKIWAATTQGKAALASSQGTSVVGAYKKKYPAAATS